MPLYSTVNAYTPLQASRIYDADVIFASVDNILKTPPRVRLFHPRGFEPEQFLFSKNQAVLPNIILHTVYVAVLEDPRLIMLYDIKDIFNDYEAYALYLNFRFDIKGFTGRNFMRQLTISRTPQ